MIIMKIVTVLCMLFCSGWAQQCGTVGHTGMVSDDANDARREDVFYINIGDPAGCDGMITSISFCFYSAVSTGNFYSATFAIYRPQGNDYNAVSTPREIRINQTQYSNILDLGSIPQVFGCSTMDLADPLMIQQDDVLGICVVNPTDEPDVIQRLELAGRAAGVNGDLLRIRNPAPSECSTNSVPALVDRGSSSNNDVYLSATIVPLPTEPPQTESPTTMPTTIATTQELTTSEATTPEATTPEATTPEATTSEATTPEATEERSVTGDSTTAQMQTNDNPMTMTPATTNNGNTTGDPSSSTTDPTGAIVAVVIILLLVIIVAVTVVIIAVVVRKGKTDSRDIRTVSAVNAIDNLVYGQKETLHRLESAEHTYEFEQSPTFSDEYAEIESPYDIPASVEVVYESPLDTPAVSYSKLLQKNQEEDIYQGENPYEVPASQERDIYAQLKSWGAKSLLIQDFSITGHLGSGQFGNVEKGVWTIDSSRQVDVALKSLTSTEEQDKVKFLQEAAIMAQFKHPNVIKLHGVITRNKPMMLVVEMADRGDLRNHLLSMRPDPGELVPSDTPELLLRFSRQVALGMQYLSAKGFIHRDLAARNMLLTSTNVCKVADFGMSRDLADESYYMSQGKDKIPVKWTAPEALNFKKYSTASDVWAYGCLLYEIWSIGHKPFEGLSNVEVLRVVDTGTRLAPPPGCPRMVYQTMIKCWHPESAQRPVFRDIVISLIQKEAVVLEIPQEQLATNTLSGVLGASLKEATNLYPDLQNTYN